MPDALWDPIRFLETEPTARTFLTDRYQTSGIELPERHAFQQSTRLVYTWKQARAFYRAASGSELLVKPLLLFYGCTHLLKGYILSRDPHYPQNSRMLQHGVTTRKIKKNPYHLLEDEVRPQKEGFFAYAAKMLSLTPIQERYTVQQLFCSMPELVEGCRGITRQIDWEPIHFSQERSIVTFPTSSEGSLAFSNETFLHFLNRRSPAGIQFSRKHLPIQTMTGGGDQKSYFVSTTGTKTLLDHSLFARTSTGGYYFWNNSTDHLPLPEWASHFLLLYILGMLCRYETEWWGELVYSHAFAETYLVKRFLAFHQTSFPLAIIRLLERSE